MRREDTVGVRATGEKIAREPLRSFTAINQVSIDIGFGGDELGEKG